MISAEQKNIAQWAMDLALSNGCSGARVCVTVANNNSFEYRNTQLEKLQQSSENKLYVELFVDARYGTLSTNRLDKKNELEQFIKDGIISTRFLAKDNCRQLPDPKRYYIADDNKDLDLSDKYFFDYSTEQKLELAKSIVSEVYGADDKIVSVSASYDDGCGAEYMIASNGFEGESLDTAYSLTAEVALKSDGDARPEGYWFDSKLYWTDLNKSGIGITALQRALQKLGQTKVKSGNYMMLLDNTVSARILSPLISAMYGSAIQQKNTFLLNKLNKQVASSLLTIIDKPHTQRSFGSRLYDSEGVATKEYSIIKDGILNTYFIDSYNSLKLDVAPTISSPSIITFEMGNKDIKQLIGLIDKGIWVTGFNGGNTNGTSGDFSFGVEGFFVENGVAIKPIGEMNVTGNMLDLWRNLIEVGNDPLSVCSSRQVPSLLFENVSFSGL